MIEPRVAPMVRKMAMSLALSFTSMIRPEIIFSAATSTMSDRDNELQVALHFQRREKRAIALPPIRHETGPLQRILDSRAVIIHLVGVFDKNLNGRHVIIAVEIKLGLIERQIDKGRIIFRHADFKNRTDRVGLHTRRESEWR